MVLNQGIDVSVHNGSPNWETVKNSGGVSFVIMRAGYGKTVSQKDKQFERNYSECKRLGIPVGAYWYSYAMSPSEARQEAKACMEVIKGKQFEYPIYYDVEDKKQLSLGKQTVSAIITAFCEELEANGYFVGVYSSKSYFKDLVSDKCKTDYTSWVAAWSSKPNYSDPMDIWQKSDKGSVSGINGPVDLDECYRDFPSIIKKIGKNGFEKAVSDSDALVKPAEETSTPEKPVENLVKPVEGTKTPEKPVEVKQKKLFDVEIICNSLNVRTGPSLSAKSVGIARHGEVYAIAEEKNGWGKIAEKNLWISILSKYVKKV